MACRREDTQQWWADTLARDPAELEEDEEPPPTPRTASLSGRRGAARGSRRAKKERPTGRSSGSRRSVSRSTPTSWSGSAATRSISTESSNGCSPCCCASRTFGRGRSRADPFGKTNGAGLMHEPAGLLSAMRYTRFTTRTECGQGGLRASGHSGKWRASASPIPRLTGGSIDVSNATEKRNDQNCEACVHIHLAAILPPQPIWQRRTRGRPLRSV